MTRTSISLLIPLIFVTACGGGSSTVNNPAAPPPPTGFVITPTNGMQVAGVAYGSVVSSGDVAGLAGNTGLTAGGSGGLAKPALNSTSGHTLISIMQKIPFGPLTLDCAVTGSFTVSGELENPPTFTAGDTIVAEYANCDDGLGEVLDGTLNFVVDAFTGDIFTGIYDMTMTMNLVDFQATTDADVVMANGDGTATLNTLAAPYVEASVSGNAMTTDTNSGSETLTTYSSAQTLDAGLDPAPYTMVASGTLDSSQLPGAIDYSTPVMFQGFDSDYPHIGELLVSGDSSSIRLIAVDNVDVLIEVYSNAAGTGAPDDTIATTWAELAAL